MKEIVRTPKKQKKLAKAVWAVWAALCLVTAAGFLFCHWYPVSQGPPEPWLAILLDVGLLLLLFSFVLGALGVFILPWAFIRYWRYKYTTGIKKLLTVVELAWPLGVLFFAVDLDLAWKIRHRAFADLAERSRPLVQAIERFEDANSRPPETLNELIPAYFAEIPGTGLRAYPKYEYRIFRYAGAKLFWYDLGPRGGEKLKRLRTHGFGDRDHAILVFAVKNEAIMDVDTDRVPDNPGDLAFDRRVWDLKDTPKRLLMLNDLLAHTEFTGKPTAMMQNMLGPPDGEFTPSSARWELRVRCPQGIFNWDEFFYRPDVDYPHIGSVELVGDWAYVHE